MLSGALPAGSPRLPERPHASGHYTCVELRQSALQGIALGLREWRASRLRDPVARLQFLQGHPAREKSASPLRHLPAPAITLGLALAGGAMLHPWTTPPHARPMATPSSALPSSAPPSSALHEIASSPAATAPPRVWLVETTSQSDLYSNGLRVENRFAASTSPRKYVAYSRAQTGPPSGVWRSEPAGIVFHTTESHLAPFEEQENRALRRDGEGLLEYVNRQRAYHFVIDRFGRVFRVVEESDYANHAGNSIWADDDWIYLNLNQSFLAIAFEARSNPQADEPGVNQAQVHAGRILVEMLRARYAIPAANCVAHAQVSVNPSNGRAGYHTDWAAHLPFADLGLGDNYSRPLASVALFGFEADGALLQSGGAPLARGIQAAEEAIRRQAAERNLPIDKYRRMLRARYQEAVANGPRTPHPSTPPIP